MALFIEEDDGPRPRSRGRRKYDHENEGWSLERKLLIITCACSVIGAAFSAGLNWAKLVNVQDAVIKLQSFQESASELFVPREVYNINQRELTKAIDKLSATLERMQEKNNKDDDRLPIGVRRFDR
jgi:hypothetical protein